MSKTLRVSFNNLSQNLQNLLLIIQPRDLHQISSVTEELIEHMRISRGYNLIDTYTDYYGSYVYKFLRRSLVGDSKFELLYCADFVVNWLIGNNSASNLQYRWFNLGYNPYLLSFRDKNNLERCTKEYKIEFCMLKELTITTVMGNVSEVKYSQPFLEVTAYDHNSEFRAPIAAFKWKDL